MQVARCLIAMVYALGDVPRSQFILWRYISLSLLSCRLCFVILHQGLELTSILQQLGFTTWLRPFTTSAKNAAPRSLLQSWCPDMWSCHVGLALEQRVSRAARIRSWRPNVLWRAERLYDLLMGGEWQRKKQSIRLIAWLTNGFDDSLMRCDELFQNRSPTLPDCSWIVRDTTLEHSYWVPSLLDWAVLRVWFLWRCERCSMGVCGVCCTCLRCHRSFCLLHNGNSFAVAPGEGRRAWTSESLIEVCGSVAFQTPVKRLDSETEHVLRYFFGEFLVSFWQDSAWQQLQ